MQQIKSFIYSFLIGCLSQFQEAYATENGLSCKEHFSNDPIIREKQLWDVWDTIVPYILYELIFFKASFNQTDLKAFPIPRPDNPFAKPSVQYLKFHRPLNQDDRNAIEETLTIIQHNAEMLLDVLNNKLTHKRVLSEAVFKKLQALYYNDDNKNTNNLVGVSNFTAQFYINLSLGLPPSKLRISKWSRDEANLLAMIKTYLVRENRLTEHYLSKIKSDKFQKHYFRTRPTTKIHHLTDNPIPYKSYPIEISVLEGYPHMVPWLQIEKANRKTKEEKHTTRVSSIIAAKTHWMGERMLLESHQLKGIIPGASIIPVDLDGIDDGKGHWWPNQKDLLHLKQSRARVVNLSADSIIPHQCVSALLKDENKNSNPICQAWRNFAQLIDEKDMILVIAAGNESYRKEFYQTDTSSKKPKFRVFPGFRNICLDNEKSISFSEIVNFIPKLKGRYIMVGALETDGRTIAPFSNISSKDTQDNFVYAVSNQFFISNSIKLNKKSLQEDLRFSGTSSATPVASGIMALLGAQFPNIPMKTIKNVVLQTSDKISEDSQGIDCWHYSKPLPKGFNELIHQKSEYFGRGIVNYEKAYRELDDLTK